MNGYGKRQESVKKYTKPKKRYKYQQIPFDEYMNYMDFWGNRGDALVKRSSFIPYTVQNGERVWILGSFWDYPRQILTDFGGSCQYENNKKINLTPLGCATKELHEESKGLLTRPILTNFGEIPLDKYEIYRGIAGREIVYFVLVPLNPNESEKLITKINQKDYSKERLGPVDFYTENDILSKRYLTTNYLTDFVDYYRTNQSRW